MLVQGSLGQDKWDRTDMRLPAAFFYFYFFLILFLNFTILYWFCQISKWICHRYTCVPHREPSSLLPPHTIPLMSLLSLFCLPYVHTHTCFFKWPWILYESEICVKGITLMNLLPWRSSQKYEWGLPEPMDCIWFWSIEDIIKETRNTGKNNEIGTERPKLSMLLFNWGSNLSKVM